LYFIQNPIYASSENPVLENSLAGSPLLFVSVTGKLKKCPFVSSKLAQVEGLPTGDGEPKNSSRWLCERHNEVNDMNNDVLETIVSTCPKLELLHIGYQIAFYGSCGLKAVADGLPNLTALFFDGSWVEKEVFPHLCSKKKQGLSALGVTNNEMLRRTGTKSL
jgi:hypothetical protein